MSDFYVHVEQLVKDEDLGEDEELDPGDVIGEDGEQDEPVEPGSGSSEYGGYRDFNRASPREEGAKGVLNGPVRVKLKMRGASVKDEVDRILAQRLEEMNGAIVLDGLYSGAEVGLGVFVPPLVPRGAIENVEMCAEEVAEDGEDEQIMAEEGVAEDGEDAQVMAAERVAEDEEDEQVMAAEQVAEDGEDEK